MFNAGTAGLVIESTVNGADTDTPVKVPEPEGVAHVPSPFKNLL